MSDKICKSCSSSRVEKYCPNCGEARYSKISFKHIVGEVLSNLFNFEGPLLKTIKGLTVSPKTVLQGYISGSRKVYHNPFQFYILSVTVYVIVYSFLQYKLIPELPNEILAEDENFVTSYNDFFIYYLTPNLSNIMLIQPPIFAFFLWLLFKKNTSYSYPENLVISLYMNGQILLYTCVLYALEYILPHSSNSLTIIISIIYYSFCMYQLVKNSLIRTIIKTTFIYITVILVIVILAIVLYALRTLIY